MTDKWDDQLKTFVNSKAGLAKMSQRIYLASRSPRRRELLKQIGLPFELLMFREQAPRKPDVDETPLSGEAPDAYVQRIARAKVVIAARLVLERNLPWHNVLSADTTVALGDKILGKPADNNEAMAMMRELSGKTHEVHSAIAMTDGSAIEVALSSSRVTFGELSEEDIKAYVLTGESLDKAGGYAIQGRAAAFISRLEGSYSGVMGLPLYETIKLVQRFVRRE
ncbi:MAG: Maf family protein [Burkholderiales bacterium]